MATTMNSDDFITLEHALAIATFVTMATTLMSRVQNTMTLSK